MAAAGNAEITWRPGFHDHDWTGWLVTLGYLAALTVVLLNTRPARTTGADPGDRSAWRWLGALLLALGVNQQLDLQTLLIQAGRWLSSNQGWYEHRRWAQKVFFWGFAAGSLALGLAAAARGRRFFLQHRLVTLGVGVLLGFIVLRAASLDHVGEAVLERAQEAAWKDLVELGGLLLVFAGAVRHQVMARGPGA